MHAELQSNDTDLRLLPLGEHRRRTGDQPGRAITRSPARGSGSANTSASTTGGAAMTAKAFAGQSSSAPASGYFDFARWLLVLRR